MLGFRVSSILLLKVYSPHTVYSQYFQACNLTESVYSQYFQACNLTESFGFQGVQYIVATVAETKKETDTNKQTK